MKSLEFRKYHLIELLKSFDSSNKPLDLCVANYFRGNKALGSKDRAAIAENVYVLVRHNLLLEHFLDGHKSWQKKIELFQTLDLEAISQDISIPDHIRVSFPKELWDLVCSSLSREEAFAFAQESNKKAPVTIRVNTIKTTREDLLNRWKGLYQIKPCQKSPLGIEFKQKIHFFSLPEFREGFFEIQDEGSQLLANLVLAKPGDLILDYCSGSGGKTLAIAPLTEGQGQIYLHDIRPFALQEAKRRLKRAGIQNAQVILPDSAQLKKIKKKMDWVLVDAPCSGTGTLRRNPDMKEKIDKDMVKRLVSQQRMIFEKALSFLKPDGRIVFGTCSILSQENQEQMEHFINTYNLEVVGTPFQSFPHKNGMDGFFAVVLKQKSLP